MMTLFLLISLSSFTLMLASSPFILCMSLIFLVSALCLYFHSISSFWFTYTLIIMFLGGMMVIFSYASSMNSGFKLNLKWNSVVLTSSVIFLFNFSGLSGMSFMKGSVKSSTCLNYNTISSPVMLIMAGLLLSTLFIVVKMVRVEEGPLKL